LKGVSASVVRLPQVHDPIKQGLVTYLIAVAREKGLSAYGAEGRNRWAAAHVSDVAHLYRLALEKHEAGAKYHAVAEEGVSMRDICRNDRSRLEGSGGFPIAGKGCGTFWVACDFRRLGYARFKRANSATSRMATHGSRIDCRP
jgi:nucleoside-diphosphate-sugar epimerase